MANSVHTARWVSQLADTGWDIHVFDLQKAGLTPELKVGTVYTFCRATKATRNVAQHHYVWPFSTLWPLPRGERFVLRYLLPPIWKTFSFPEQIPWQN